MATDTVQTNHDEPLTFHMDLGTVRQQLQRAERMAPNVSSMERMASGIIGAGIAGFGFSCRSIPGALLAIAGIALLERGLTGHCDIYQKMASNTAEKK